MLDLDRAAIFMSRLSIRKKDGQIIPFRFNACQKLVHQQLKDRQTEDGVLWAMVLKARRVGISTYAEALITAHCFAEENARAMIIAHKAKSSKALFGVAKMMRDSVKAWMPAATQSLMTYPGTNAELQVQTAGSATSGRGLSLSAVHFSEAAFYEQDAHSLISVLPAIPKKPGTLVIIESTANGKAGVGRAFFDYWIGAMEGRNAFTPIFIPWTMDPECTYDEEAAEDAPSDQEEEELMASGISRSQIAWRRLTIETECRGSLDFFHQEYPRTWEEAFVSSGNPAFNQAERLNASKYLRPPLLNKRKPPLTLLPVRRESDKQKWDWFPDSEGVVIWEKAQREPFIHKYYIGVDVARGKALDNDPDKKDQSDYSAFSVWNGTTGDQAARYAARCDPFVLANMVDMVGREYNNAMAIVELTGGFGAWTQKHLRDVYHYPNIYRWKGSKDDSLPGKTQKQALGWETTYQSRRQLMASFREMLRYDKIHIFDPELLAQIEAATYDEDWRWELEVGHDDILISAMLCIIAMMQYPPPTRMMSKVVDPDAEAAEEYAQSIDEHPMARAKYKSDPLYSLIRHYRKVRRKQPKVGDRLEGI